VKRVRKTVELKTLERGGKNRFAAKAGVIRNGKAQGEGDGVAVKTF